MEVVVTSMPIRPTLPPTALKGQENGAVDEALLETVDRAGYVWKLASLPARGMRALHAAILHDLGITLSSTGRGRSFQTQYTVFLQRYSPVSKQIHETLPPGKRRIWPEAVSKYGLTSIYWGLKPGNAMAAVPGTSPHGMWCADDLCLPGNKPLTPTVLAWLYGHEMDYGFAHSTESENWHIQHFVGDAVMPAVLAYEKQHQPPPKPGGSSMLIKNAAGPDCWLVYWLPTGKRCRTQLTEAQLGELTAAYGPLTEVADVTKFGYIVGTATV